MQLGSDPWSTGCGGADGQYLSLEGVLRLAEKQSSFIDSRITLVAITGPPTLSGSDGPLLPDLLTHPSLPGRLHRPTNPGWRHFSHQPAASFTADFRS